MDFPQPISQQQMQRFIGLVNFYHRLIPHGAELLQPLHTLLSSKSKPQELTWNKKTAAAFIATKEAFATLLYYPKHDTPTYLLTDASDIAVGAVLQRYVDGTWHSVFSKKTKPAETHCSMFDRELLAIQHFQHVLEGWRFHVLTDHKPYMLIQTDTLPVRPTV